MIIKDFFKEIALIRKRTEWILFSLPYSSKQSRGPRRKTECRTRGLKSFPWRGRTSFTLTEASFRKTLEPISDMKKKKKGSFLNYLDRGTPWMDAIAGIPSVWNCTASVLRRETTARTAIASGVKIHKEIWQGRKNSLKLKRKILWPIINLWRTSRRTKPSSEDATAKRTTVSKITANAISSEHCVVHCVGAWSVKILIRVWKYTRLKEKTRFKIDY